MASSMGKARTVPKPLRKVRLGICHLRIITMVDDVTGQNLQIQANDFVNLMTGVMTIACRTCDKQL
jgi:hypothetical protein